LFQNPYLQLKGQLIGLEKFLLAIKRVVSAAALNC
jgi:hypothetical protein